MRAYRRYSESVRDFYRTEMGKTLRVEETEEGALTVAVLKEGYGRSRRSA